MRIRKYNENNKLDINISIFDSNYRKLGELMNFDMLCKKLMLDYLIINPKLQEDPDIELDQDSQVYSINLIDFHNAYYGAYKQKYSQDKYIEVTYFPDRNHDDDNLCSAWLSEDDVIDFLEFTKNPYLYKSAKKFNV